MPCDVFISYSQLDDSFPRGWVSHLQQRLESAFRVIAPTFPITVGRDIEDVPKDENFNDRIRALLAEAHVLLCVVSQAYINSTYCGTELDFFIRKTKVGQPHLARILKNAVSVTHQHEALQSCIGHDFYDKRTNSDLPILTDRGEPHPRFDAAVSPLAREIVDRVREARAPRQSVLLLAAGDRHEEARRMAGDLRHDGVVVLTAQDLPHSYKDRKAAIELGARDVDFTVLLLGSGYSADIARAYQVLSDKWTGPERRCLFSSPILLSADEQQRVFHEEIRTASEAFDIVDDPTDTLPETRRLLAALRDRAHKIPTLYLAYPKSSRASAESLRAHIHSVQRSAPIQLRVLDPYGDGSPQLSTETLAKDILLHRSHGTLILTEAQGEYVQNVLSDIEGKVGPARCIAVYAASQDARVPIGVMTKYPIIQGAAPPPYDWVTPDARTVTLTEFLESVKASAGS